jgi:hypothetical protein
MSRRFILVGLAMLVIGLTLAPTADAEIIRLKNGRMLQGEIDAAETSDDAITITLYRDGAVLRVLWDHVLGRDMRRLREALGLDVLEGDTFLMRGHLLRLRNGGLMKGLLMPAPAGGGDDSFFLKTADGGASPQAVPRGLVAGEPEEIDIPVLEIYTVPEAVDLKVKEIFGGRSEEDLIGADHAEIGDYCYKLGAYADAKKYYELALADEAFTDRTRILNKQQTLDVLIQAKEAGELFNRIKKHQFLKRYLEALQVVAEFREKFGHMEKVLSIYHLDQVQKRLEVALKKQRVQRIAVEWSRLMGTKIRAKVRDRDASFKEVQTWAQKDLSNEIVTELSAKLELEKEAVLDLWKQREAKARTATFGYGSFAAPEELAKAKARKKSATKNISREEIRRRLMEAARRRRNQSASKERPPKTADEWWSAANSASRRNWLTAYYVEHGNAGFEVLRTYYDLCGQCAGKGYKVINVAQAGSGSGQEKQRCITCNGHGRVRMIRYK